MVTTLKGLYRLGDNLLVRFAGSFRFVPSSHTCSPMLNSLKRGLSLIEDSCALRCASWAACLASVMLLSRWFSAEMAVVLGGWWWVGGCHIRCSTGAFGVVSGGPA